MGEWHGRAGDGPVFAPDPGDWLRLRSVARAARTSLGQVLRHGFLGRRAQVDRSASGLGNRVRHGSAAKRRRLQCVRTRIVRYRHSQLGRAVFPEYRVPHAGSRGRGPDRRARRPHLCWRRPLAAAARSLPRFGRVRARLGLDDRRGAPSTDPATGGARTGARSRSRVLQRDPRAASAHRTRVDPAPAWAPLERDDAFSLRRRSLGSSRVAS